MIHVLEAPPYCAVQDLGWATGRAIGLPRGGAMDPPALESANILLGNAAGDAGLEWSLGEGRLGFESYARLVLAGARGAAWLDGRAAPCDTVLEAHSGSELRLGPPEDGAFRYVCLAGGVGVPPVLGGRSTLLTAGFGGHEGRVLRAGDRIPVGPMPERASPAGLALPAEARPRADDPIAVIEGPQRSRFPASAWEALLRGTFRIAQQPSRMGYRLEGPPIAAAGLGELPSEAAVPGAIQIPASGQPIVLMPDGPTIGGYPRLAVALADDLARLAQRRPGESVRFAAVTLAEAHARLRARRARLEALARRVAEASG